jgi:hypothetical protein
MQTGPYAAAATRATAAAAAPTAASKDIRYDLHRADDYRRSRHAAACHSVHCQRSCFCAIPFLACLLHPLVSVVAKEPRKLKRGR